MNRMSDEKLSQIRKSNGMKGFGKLLITQGFHLSVNTAIAFMERKFKLLGNSTLIIFFLFFQLLNYVKRILAQEVL